MNLIPFIALELHFSGEDDIDFDCSFFNTFKGTGYPDQLPYIRIFSIFLFYT